VAGLKKMSENQKGFVLLTASKNKQRKPIIFNQLNKHPSSSIYSSCFLNNQTDVNSQIGSTKLTVFFTLIVLKKLILTHIITLIFSPAFSFWFF